MEDGSPATKKKDDDVVEAPAATNNDGNDDDDNDNDGIGPRGRWRNKFCDCTETLGCTTLCIMSFCCNVVLLSQLMTRLGLDWCGIPNPKTAASTFGFVVLIYLCCWASYLMVFGVVFMPCMVFWIWAIQTRTRYQMRQYFGIPTSLEQCAGCCDGMGEDCVITTFCSCCASIQMARHTHDENRYPYKFSLPTGLPPDAPPLYEDPLLVDQL